MKFQRSISSVDPHKCHMIAKGFFGNIKGRVQYADYGIQMLGGKNGYFVMVNDECKGAATDFFAACDMLMNELGVITTVNA